LTEYAAAFLAQLFHIGWVGAIVVTLQTWLICTCAGYLLKSSGLKRLSWARFAPALLILAMYGQYIYCFTVTTSLSLALLFTCLYVRIVRPADLLPHTNAGRDCLAHTGVFLLLSVVLYTIAAGAFLLFAMLCATYELLFRRRMYALLYVPAAFAIAYAEGVLVFGASIMDSFFALTPFSWDTLLYRTRARGLAMVSAFYLLIPAILLIAGFWRILTHKWLSGMSPRRAENNEKSRGVITSLAYKISACHSRPKLKLVAQPLILLAIAIAGAALSIDHERRTLFQVDYYACHRMWPQVLKAAKQHAYDDLVAHAVNRALYHTGQLGYDMFSWPQHPDILMLTGDQHSMSYWKRYDTRLDLGLLNLAQKDLVECMEVFGVRPIILKRLALINMAKNDTGSARIYLGALSKTLFDARWAESYIKLLEKDPNLSTDNRIQSLRSVMLKSDDPTLFSGREKLLSTLLAQNSKNHMAFEYTNALYLQTKQLDKFVQNLKILNQFTYKEIPRLYEEAILIHMTRTKELIELAGHKGSRESYERMQRFGQVVNCYGGDKKAAFKELTTDFGDSYFFFYLYGFSGAHK